VKSAVGTKLETSMIPVQINICEAQGFSKCIVDAIDCLTRRQNESYEQFIIRIKPNSLACKVKLADIEDNMA
jgi:hypothetical protein